MDKKRNILYNPFFHFPFVLWVVTGGVLLRCYDKQTLFSAINTHNTEMADVIMYYITFMGQAEVIIPMLVLLLFIPAFRNWWYFFTALLCNLVPLFIQQYIKSWLNLPRPQLLIHDPALIHFIPKWPVLLHTSFPSGHSEGAFSFFCFLSLLLTARYRAWGLLFFLLAVSVCYSRIYLAAHFFEDVYAGSIIGTIGTSLVFFIMSKYKVYFFTKKEAFT